MKTIKFVGLFLIILGCNNKNTELKEQESKRKIKSIIEVSYYGIEKFGKVEKTDKISEDKTIYDVNGNIIEEESIHTSNKSFDFKNSYIYNDKNEKIEFTYENEDGKGINTYSYNDNGDVIEENECDSSKNLKYRIIHNYTYGIDKEKEDIINYYNKDGALLGRRVCKFDKNGNKIEDSNYYADGSVYNKTICVFDGKNNLIEENIINPRKLFSSEANKRIDSRYPESYIYPSKTIYEYDDKNQNIKKTYFSVNNPSDKPSEYIMKYDNLGNKIEENYFDYENNYGNKFIFKYDKNNNEIERNMFDRYNNLKSKQISKYDKYNNIIEYIIYFIEENQTEIRITERDIEYY